MRSENPRKAFAALIFALGALAVLPLAGACAGRSDIVLGFGGSLSGSDHMLGEEGRNTAELFVNRVNAEGGIGGRRLRLVVEDFRSTMTEIVPADEALARAGAVAIVGHFTSATAEAALDFANRARIDLISPTATAESLSGKADYFFRTIMSSKRDPAILVDWMREHGQSSLLIITTEKNEAYTSIYRDYARANARVVAEIAYDNLAEIETAKLAAIKGYDAVLVLADPVDTAAIAQRLKVAGVTAPLYISGWAGNADLLTYGGSSVEGAIFVHQIDSNAESLAVFSEAYRSAYGQVPGYGAIETWDALSLIRKVLEAGGTNRRSFHRILSGIDTLDISGGSIKLDRFGDAVRPLHVIQVRNAQFIALKTVD